MSVQEDLIDFSIIESQKENIQSLPGGRSARSLANLYSVSPLEPLATPTPSDTQNLNDAIRKEYETELVNISESDDPLDIYDRYVRWAINAYPSAQATKDSQLLPLVERATKAFLNNSQYKNDPRYLKLWLLFIRHFADAPRETFAFLARHNIGESLALFYEEFAIWLESAGRWAQAEEIFRMGIEKEARPAPRLLRKYNEFQQRQAQQAEDIGPSSPALPMVRPALATKVDPFSVSASPRDPQAPRPNSGVGGSSTSKGGRQKLAIFSDADSAPHALAGGDGSKGWDSIGSLAERKKENVIQPKPMAGETLKAGGKKISVQKMAIFKDESKASPPNPQAIVPQKEQVTKNARTGRNEQIFVNLEAVYPNPDDVGTELSFEELRADARGFLSKIWISELLLEADVVESTTESADDVVEGHSENVEVLVHHIVEKLVIARDPVMLDENGAVKESNREGRSRKLRSVEVNETQIIKTKLSSPSNTKKLKRKASAEPTMTFHTKAATDDIYDLFNQPLQSSMEEEEEEEESDRDDGDDTDGDYTSGGESTGTTRLVTTSEAGDETSEVKSVSEWSEFTARKHIPNIDEDDDDNDTRATRITDDEELEGHTDNDESLSDIGVDTDFVLVDHEDVVTPVSPEPALPSARTMFVPIPPEDYEPPRHPYRDASQVSQNRLPFMTPIAEKTESSLGVLTYKGQKDYFTAKTPSKENGRDAIIRANNNMSSPFHEIINEAAPRQKITPPDLSRTITTKKTTAIASKVQSSSGILANKLVSKGPIIPDLQCNPVDEYVRTAILEGMQPPLSSYEGFFDHSTEIMGKASELRKYAKAVTKMSKNTSDRTTTNIAMPPLLKFPDCERQYLVKRELGAGAFAPVYLIENAVEEDADDEESANASVAVMGKGAFDHFSRRNLEALKMEDPPTAWEFHMMRLAKRRLGVSRAAESILDVYEMHLYKDECYLIEQYRDQGTLLDLVNIARADSSQPGGVMDEMLVMFFTIELFRTVESLHSKGVLHGDLKADNCLVRLDPIEDTCVWNSQFSRDGSGGWNQKGVSLIDFGRGIDMKAFKPEVQFIADWKTSAADCAEMRELRPWTYQIDYHGLAGIIHSMLFGKYIETIQIVDRANAGIGGASGAFGKTSKLWRVKENLKRYWQTEIWKETFDLLLNPCAHLEGEEGVKLPVLKGMKAIRESMEAWLEANCDKGVGLCGSLRRLEGIVGGKKK